MLSLCILFKVLFLILDGLGLRWLGAGLGFPARDRQLRWRKHQILATRQVVSDKGPVPSALQKRISTKMESSEANSVH